MIAVILFLLALTPSWIYLYWLINKQQKDPSYKRARYKILGYLAFGTNFLILLILATNHNSKKEEEYAVKTKNDKLISEQKFNQLEACSRNLNSQLPKLTVKNLIVHFEANKETRSILVVVYNEYLHIHQHEQKQLKQLILSYTKSFCGEERPFHIVDQLSNFL